MCIGKVDISRVRIPSTSLSHTRSTSQQSKTPTSSLSFKHTDTHTKDESNGRHQKRVPQTVLESETYETTEGAASITHETIAQG